MIAAAVDLGWSDLEDAIVNESARQAGATVVATRNLHDFSASSLTVLDPERFVAMIQATPPSR